LRHAHGLSQQQDAQALMFRQSWIALSLKLGLRPRLPFAWLCQISSEPRASHGTLYAFQFVVRYFSRADFMRTGYPSCCRCAWLPDLRNEAGDLICIMRCR
jgi:hypothetical protein